MVHDDPFDLSFISATLREGEGLLREASVAYRMHDRATCDAKLFKAGAEAQEALTKLYFHPLWDKLREEQQQRMEQWVEFKLPVVKNLFVMLGYEPASNVPILTDLGNEELKRAAGISGDNNIDHIALAKARISDLYYVLERLMDRLYKAIQTNELSSRVMDGLREQILNGLWVACKTLAKGLAIAIMLPAAELAMNKLGPPAAEMLHQLQDSTHILPSVPMVLAASLPGDIINWANYVATAATREQDEERRRPPQPPTSILSAYGRITGPGGTSEAPANPVPPLWGRPDWASGVTSAPTGQPQAPRKPSSSPPGTTPGAPPGVTES